MNLYRVWFSGKWILVNAESVDDLYRRFPRRKRERITAVQLVHKTSECVGAPA